MKRYNGDLEHVPVLMEEVLEALRIRSGGVYLDGTLGLGGHTARILSGYEGTRVIGIDRDPLALEMTRRRLERFGSRLKLFRTNYRRLSEVVAEAGYDQVDGILLDLGVSSMQLDSPARGFSFSSDGPLDMRMNPESGLAAEEIINSWSKADLARIFYRYGEEKLAGKVAAAIVREREREPIKTTGRLADIVRSVPGMGRVRNIHPATRTFQALRIAVNDELAALEEGLPAAVRSLRSGGRLAVIAFHSLEDRIVKRAFKAMADPCICPRELPVCTCGRESMGQVVTKKAIRPGRPEMEANPRSRSARLRVFEKA